MNERIRQLAEQAGLVKILEEHAHEYGDGTFENTPYPELEKFAELIVAEAIAVVQRRFMGDLNREDMEVRRCVEDVKKHFGVEE